MFFLFQAEAQSSHTPCPSYSFIHSFILWLCHSFIQVIRGEVLCNDAVGAREMALLRVYLLHYIDMHIVPLPPPSISPFHRFFQQHRGCTSFPLSPMLGYTASQPYVNFVNTTENFKILMLIWFFFGLAFCALFLK